MYILRYTQIVICFAKIQTEQKYSSVTFLIFGGVQGKVEHSPQSETFIFHSNSYSHSKVSEQEEYEHDCIKTDMDNFAWEFLSTHDQDTRLNTDWKYFWGKTTIELKEQL